MPHRRVAVIGAGAAGLASARELRLEGHGVSVFECGGGVGGAWIYSAAVESEPLGLDPNRQLVHSSLYASLRTNIPRESMGFSDYPFSAASASSGDSDHRRFPGHREVGRYLEGFARDFDLMGLIRFWSRVVCVEMEGDGRWKVVWRRSNSSGGDESEVFDGVVVCVGHYSEPRVAEIPGIGSWPGKQIHSHNYRVPEPLSGQFEYVDWLASQCGHPPVEEWRKLMYYANRKNRAAKPNRYRDEWEDDDLVIEAHEHFKKLSVFC